MPNDIPYHFCPFPREFLSIEILNEPDFFRFLGWIMERTYSISRTIIYPNNRTKIIIKLNPFQFIFGRNKCAELLNLKPKVIENFLNRIIFNKWISKSEANSGSTYSVYTLLLGQNAQKNGQQLENLGSSWVSSSGISYCAEDTLLGQNAQKNGQQIGQQFGHNERTIDSSSSKKETNKEKRESLFVNSFLSSEEQEERNVLMKISESKGLKITEQQIEIWFRKFTKEVTSRNFLYVLELHSKKPRDNFCSAMEKSLKFDHGGEQDRLNINREAFKKFKDENHWSDLNITKRYATHTPSSTDFQFKRNPDDLFKDLLKLFDLYKKTTNYGS